MGVSKNKGIPKWMVYNGKPYFLMDDLGVPPSKETSKSISPIFGAKLIFCPQDSDSSQPAMCALLVEKCLLQQQTGKNAWIFR